MALKGVESDQRYFYSKLLLFGEYSVIRDSKALAVPYNLFKGTLSFPSSKEGQRALDQELKSFSQYLRRLFHQRQDIPFEFDINSFEFDLSQGLYFDSTIPVGFGVGSSGALCAALFDRYGKISSQFNLKNDFLSLLKKVFSLLEAHFHGTSSGIDPLVSYTDQSILIRECKTMESVTIPDYSQGEGAIFLLNTGRPRRTEPLVNLFLEKCKSAEFASLCETILTPVTDRCIEGLLTKNLKQLKESFVQLSEFQFEHLTPMIPKLYQEIWEWGLKTGELSLKLCGAGGGGFMLGITDHFERMTDQLKDYNIRPLYWVP